MLTTNDASPATKLPVHALVLLGAMLGLTGAFAGSSELAIYDIDGQQIATYDDTTGTFSQSVLWNADLDGADLTAVTDARLEWVSATLKNADLTGASFNYADLFLADISAASLASSSASYADFSLAEANCTNFSKASLTSSIFYRATITCANFYAANLSNVDFRGANLSGADFSEAVLTNARFGQAAKGFIDPASSVRDTDFRASDLTGITGINNTVGAAIYDANTTLGPADPGALGWVNTPRTTLLLNGTYIQSVSLTSSASQSQASLAGGTVNDLSATKLDASTLLNESVGFRMAGVGAAEELTLSLTLTAAVPDGEAFLWSSSGTDWEPIASASITDGIARFTTTDGGDFDASPTAGLIQKTLALSVTATPTAPAVPVPVFPPAVAILLAGLMLLQAQRKSFLITNS